MNTPVPLLDVQDFGLEFRTRSGTVHALQRVNLQIHKGEIVGLVGESGSGKSVLSYAMLGISDAAARVTSGRALFGGMDLLKASPSELANLRGREISMIFQSPRTSNWKMCCAATPWPPASPAAPVPNKAAACAKGPSRRCATWPLPTPNAATAPTPSSCRAACASA
jgi:hypothetical protein